MIHRKAVNNRKLLNKRHKKGIIVKFDESLGKDTVIMHEKGVK